MKLVESSPSDVSIVAVAASAVPMSPMHPARPVTKYDKDVTMPNHTGVKIISSYDDESTKDGVTNGGSGGGGATAATGTGNMSHSSSPSVLKSIFSPVLNFLNHSSTKDAASTTAAAGSVRTGTGTGGQHAHGQAQGHGSKHKDKHAATSHPNVRQEATKQKHTRHEVDLDGDVRMHGGDNLDVVVAISTPTSPLVNNSNSSSNNSNNRIHVEDDDYGHFTATTPTVDSQQDEISVQHQEELDIEEEFNLYLFIKYLPPYETVVTNPHHKICLPPKDPSDPPISLVLDLDETLVHCTVEPISDADMTFPVVFNGMKYKVHVRLRPFLMDFLEAVHDKFEVIIITH